MGSQEPSSSSRPWPNASQMLANCEFQIFWVFHLSFRLAHKLLYRGLVPPDPRPDLTENLPDIRACKVIKIQHVKLKEFTSIDALIVETDVGLDGLPVLGGTGTGTGCGERFLIVRTLTGADARALENIIWSSREGGDKKTERIATWIQDLISSGPHPKPEADDHRLGDTIVAPPDELTFNPVSDMIFKITGNNVLPSHEVTVVNEIEVPPQSQLGLDKSDKGLSFYKLLLIIRCVQKQKVFSVFQRQRLWFIRLIWLLAENVMLCRDQSKISSGDGGDERTDLIRVFESNQADPANSNSYDRIWKRVFISKIEKRLAQEVMERFSVQLEEDKQYPGKPAQVPAPPAVKFSQKPMPDFGAKARIAAMRDREILMDGLRCPYGRDVKLIPRYPLCSTVAKGFVVARRLWNCIRRLA